MKNRKKHTPEEEPLDNTAVPESEAQPMEKDVEIIDATAPETPESRLEAELAAERDRYLRLAAEYDNFRKRSQKERENIYADVRADTVLRLLPVYDNLERALKQETPDEAYYKGVEMILAGFHEALEKLGVTEIPTVGEQFDPVLHNAVMHTEDETKGENEIIEELQKGFRLGDKVIRFSLVVVAN